MKNEADVWIMPESQIVLVDGYMCGPVVECCNLPDSTLDFIKQLFGIDGVVKGFSKWHEAVQWAYKKCPKGWTVECSSPEGDMAAAIALDEY